MTHREFTESDTELAFERAMRRLGSCKHPTMFRRPIPNYHSDDPNEWECALCGTWQVKDNGSHAPHP